MEINVALGTKVICIAFRLYNCVTFQDHGHYYSTDKLSRFQRFRFKFKKSVSYFETAQGHFEVSQDRTQGEVFK